MKLCLVSAQYDSVQSGQGRYCRNLVDGLISNGHSVTLIIPQSNLKNQRNETIGKLDIHRLHTIHKKGYIGYFQTNFAYAKTLGQFFKGFSLADYDILHVLNINYSSFVNRNILKQTKVIVSINDFYALITPINPFRFPFPTRDVLVRYVYYNIIKVLYCGRLRKAHAVFTNTRFLGRIINEKARIKHDKIVTIHRGVDIEEFKLKKDNKYNSRKILFIGKNIERKGLPYLLNAMSGIIKEFPDTQLTIISSMDKNSEKTVNSIMQKHKLGNHVKIVSSAMPDEIKEYYWGANVFVMPSIIENLAQTILEAMATGTPVIATKALANDEALSSSEGIIIKPKSADSIKEAIIKLFKNPKLAEKLGNNGSKKIKAQFSKAVMIDKTIKAYEELIS